MTTSEEAHIGAAGPLLPSTVGVPFIPKCPENDTSNPWGGCGGKDVEQLGHPVCLPVRREVTGGGVGRDVWQ